MPDITQKMSLLLTTILLTFHFTSSLPRTIDSLHEYPDTDPKPQTPPTKPNLTFNLTNPTSSPSNTDSAILSSVYAATKQLPSTARPETLQPTYRFAFDFLKKKFPKKFSVSDIFEKAGHKLATKLFGSSEKYYDSYERRKKSDVYPQYEAEADFPTTPSGYNAYISENYQTTPYGYTVVYSKGERVQNAYVDNSENFQEPKNCNVENKSVKKQTQNRAGYGDEYEDESYGSVSYGSSSYGGSGGELIAELKEKLKSLFMLVLPLVPIALILATVIPSSVFVPSRSGSSTLLPLNGTSGINLMQLTPGTTTNLGAKKVVRGEDYGKNLKDFGNLEDVVALAESSGLLHATLSKLVANLGPLFVKYAESVMGTKGLSEKKKAIVMDKILRRVGQDLVKSLKKLNETDKVSVKSESESEKNKTSRDDPGGFSSFNDVMGSVMGLYRAVNRKPELVSSVLGLFPSVSNFSFDFIEKFISGGSRKKRSFEGDEGDDGKVMEHLENSLRELLNEKKEKERRKLDKTEDFDDGKKSFAEKAMSTWNAVKGQLHSFLSRSDDDPNCLQRIICQNAHVGQEEEANLPQRVLWKIVTRLENVAPSQFGIRSLMKNARYGRCKRYYCPLSKLKLTKLFF